MPSSLPNNQDGDDIQKYRLEEYDDPSNPHNPNILRLYRSHSWMRRAEEMLEMHPRDPDEAFIFYWIAFNALYAEDSAEPYETRRERDNFNAYFGKLLRLDTNGDINRALWERFQDEVRAFLENQFVYEPFWKFSNGVDVERYRNWAKWFDADRQAALDAITAMDTDTALKTLFDRMYVLRNQILHGAATYRSSVNRNQVRDGTAIMATLVPIFFNLMKDNIGDDWGKPYYPRLYM